MSLYEKFGEFDSADEINEAAAGQLAEGTEEGRQNIKEIALENGLDLMDAEDYIVGDVDELCNPFMAAIGKIELEIKYLGLKETTAEYDYASYILKECEADFELCKAVRKKGKSLAGAIGEVLKMAWKIKEDIHPDILKAAGIPCGRVQSGSPGMAIVAKTMREYYLGGQQDETD